MRWPAFLVAIGVIGAIGACGGAASAPPVTPAPTPTAPMPAVPAIATVSWRAMDLPLRGRVGSASSDTLVIAGGSEPLEELESHYVAALVARGWTATQRTPAREGEQPGVLDEVVGILPSMQYIGVTLARVPASADQIELSIMRDDEGTEVVLMYLTK